MSLCRVGLIGVGNMGIGIARNILRKGQGMEIACLNVYDVNTDNIKSLNDSSSNSSGSSPSSSSNSCKLYSHSRVKDVFADSDIICLSLPSEKVTADVITAACTAAAMGAATGSIAGTTGAATARRKIILDHGTFSVDFVRQMHEQVASFSNSNSQSNQSITYMDAPVSGGPTGAANGLLSIMIGGSAADVTDVSPLLSLYSSKIFHFGPVTSGMVAKLINQSLVCMHTQAVAEAILLAESYNFNEVHQVELLNSMLSQSWGASKMQELAMNDYVLKMKHGLDHLNNSAAPLRNLDKDMKCIRCNISSSIDSSSNSRILDVTAASISKACHHDKLQNHAFISLVESIKRM